MNSLGMTQAVFLSVKGSIQEVVFFNSPHRQKGTCLRASALESYLLSVSSNLLEMFGGKNGFDQ